MADPRAVRDYLTTLLEDECRWRLPPSYPAQLLRLGISPRHRLEVVEHMNKVLNRFEGAEENLVYLSVATMQMDAVLAKEPPVRDMHDFYALAGACLLLTSKYVGTRSLHAESLARFMRVSSKEHLMYMEQQVLRILDWRLQMPTPYDFINIFHYGMVLSHPLSADKARDLILRAFAISDFCCSDLTCMLFGPSIIAMASLYLSATGLDSDDDRIVAELTDEDRHTLFGLQGLFVNREQELVAAVMHIQQIFAIQQQSPSISNPTSSTASPHGPTTDRAMERQEAATPGSMSLNSAPPSLYSSTVSSHSGTGMNTSAGSPLSEIRTISPPLLLHDSAAAARVDTPPTGTVAADQTKARAVQGPPDENVALDDDANMNSSMSAAQASSMVAATTASRTSSSLARSLERNTVVYLGPTSHGVPPHIAAVDRHNGVPDYSATPRRTNARPLHWTGRHALEDDGLFADADGDEDASDPAQDRADGFCSANDLYAGWWPQTSPFNGHRTASHRQPAMDEDPDTAAIDVAQSMGTLSSLLHGRNSLDSWWRRFSPSQ